MTTELIVQWQDPPELIREQRRLAWNAIRRPVVAAVVVLVVLEAASILGFLLHPRASSVRDLGMTVLGGVVYLAVGTLLVRRVVGLGTSPRWRTTYELLPTGLRSRTGDDPLDSDADMEPWEDIRAFWFEDHPTLPGLRSLLFETGDGWDQWPLPIDRDGMATIEQTVRERLPGLERQPANET
jgi:hypothetical protein